jgi:hypothetical protein
MIAKVRKISKQFSQTHTSLHKKLLVSGCSFTYNNSESFLCSWPYYLKELAGFAQVYDCSQSGAGSNHIFNSVINEIETNSEINCDDTLIVVMWSGLSRTDVIATNDITRSWHQMSNYDFDQKFSTFSIFNQVVGDRSIPADLCTRYKKLISTDAQIYESCLKIIALEAYLRQKGFSFVFTSWQDPTQELNLVSIGSMIKPRLESLDYLGEFSMARNLIEEDGHPTPDGYLCWTREKLLPYLTSVGLTANLDSV